jgi:small-conductance mechanosensitive channel
MDEGEPIIGVARQIAAVCVIPLPGEQFVIRRQADAMIKKAFDENGIKFAFAAVQVDGEGDAASATASVAQRALELAKPAAA